MSKNPLDYSLNTPLGRPRFSFSNFLKDIPLFSSILIVLFFGFLMLYSASGQSEEMLIRQMIYALIGLIMMLVVAQLQPRSYKLIFMHLFWVGIALLLYVLFFPGKGFTTNRWIDLGLLTFQPSETIRLILPLAIASFLTRKETQPSVKDWGVVFLGIFLCFFLIVTSN